MSKLGEFIRQTGEITSEAISSIAYAIQLNLRYAANIIQLGTPYLMFVMGRDNIDDATFVAVMLVPIVSAILVFYIKQFANKNNHGSSIPIPRERFTEVGEDGEVTVRQDRLQEMLLYMADLEDWMASKGWL